MSPQRSRFWRYMFAMGIISVISSAISVALTFYLISIGRLQTPTDTLEFGVVLGIAIWFAIRATAYVFFFRKF